MTAKATLKSFQERKNAYGAFLEDGGTKVYLDDEAGLIEENEYRTHSYQESYFCVGQNGNLTKVSSIRNKEQKEVTAVKDEAKSRGSIGGGSQIHSNKENNSLWGITRSGSESSLSSGSSTELFTRGSSSEGSTHLCHDVLSNSPHLSARAFWKLTTASLLSLCFLVMEFIGGYYASSLAVFADAAMVLGDVSGFLITLFVFRKSQKPPNSEMTFGYFRTEVFGSLGCVLLMWIATALLAYEAVLRFLTPDYVINADVMVAISGAGVVFSVLTAFILQNCCCRQKSETHKLEESIFRRNSNVRPNHVYVVGKVVLSLGLLVAALVIKFYSEYKILDPILTLIYAFLVTLTTVPSLLEASRILMEGCPKAIPYSGVLSDLERIPGVRAIHDLRIWALSRYKVAVSVHLATDASFPSETVMTSAQQLIKEKYHVHMCTVQVEFYHREMESCKKCAPLEEVI